MNLAQIILAYLDRRRPTPPEPYPFPTVYGAGRTIDVFADQPIRKWVVPTDDCIVHPTNQFYRRRPVRLSNQGTMLFPKWLAVDRFNDPDWHQQQFVVDELAHVWDGLSDTELTEMRRDR
jgi:hypothetical protein